MDTINNSKSFWMHWSAIRGNRAVEVIPVQANDVEFEVPGVVSVGGAI